MDPTAKISNEKAFDTIADTNATFGLQEWKGIEWGLECNGNRRQGIGIMIYIPVFGDETNECMEKE